MEDGSSESAHRETCELFCSSKGAWKQHPRSPPLSWGGKRNLSNLGQVHIFYIIWVKRPFNKFTWLCFLMRFRQEKCKCNFHTIGLDEERQQWESRSSLMQSTAHRGFYLCHMSEYNEPLVLQCLHTGLYQSIFHPSSITPFLFPPLFSGTLWSPSCVTAPDRIKIKRISRKTHKWKWSRRSGPLGSWIQLTVLITGRCY